MLAPGSTAPDFTLPDHTGAPIALRDLLSRGPLVAFFYPGDFTPACSAQACLFRDMHTLASSAGLQVIGINPGSPRSHARFRGTFKLPYHLLSDQGKAVTRAYDALGFLGLMPRRVTYLISPEGTIADAVEASLNLSKHKAFIQRVIARTPAGATGVTGARPA